MNTYPKTTPTTYQQEEPLAVRVLKFSATIKYVAEAAPGTTDGQSGWRIKKIEATTITISGTEYNLEPKITWASGDSGFNKIFKGDSSSLLDYTYS